MSTRMEENFAVALRALLVEQVQSSSTRPARPAWPKAIGLRVALAIVLVAAGTGIAAAAAVLSLWPPGSPVITPLSSPTTVTGTGTQTITLGARPQAANAIDLAFRCLSAGTFRFADGSSAQCDQPDSGSSTMTAALPLSPGQNSATITAAAGERWEATVFYASATVSPWKTNASGQTYGAINLHGTPDLVAVIATDGRQGYVYASQLNPPPPASPAAALAQQAANTKGEYIPVYESDGTTVIGRFEVAEPGADAG